MTASYIMRPMRVDDIPQVVQVDELAFPTPWSARTYQFEITNRTTSHMVVIEAPNHVTLSVPGLRGLIQRLRGGPKPEPVIAGYGGCWLIAGEAHISTIAVHPDFRGRGLGELLLIGMLGRSMRLDGEYSVLEVRVNNHTAQQLYRKYEYQIVGTRKGYYRDNGEDAYLMEVRPFDAAYRERFKQRVAALHEKIAFIDLFTDGAG